MKLFAKLLKNRRGVSMTEVVIAMTAVVIVTGAAISVLVSSSTADIKFSAKTRAIEACESAVECLRFANDDETVLEDVLEYLGFTREDEDGYLWKYGKNETVKVNAETDSVEIEKIDENGDTVTETVYTEKYVVTYNDEVIYEIEKIENNTDEDE